MNLDLLKRALGRNLSMKNHIPYKRVLSAVASRGDVWIVSQGEYINWWDKRANGTLKLLVSHGECRVETDLANAVFEKFPGEFFTSTTIPCPDSDFDGEVQLTIDESLRRKDLLIEALRREGILNFAVGTGGEFFLSHGMDSILADMETSLLKERSMKQFHQCVHLILQAVVERLSQRNLPLVRVWYHPIVNDKVIKAVLSVRYDVDRAITNMPMIWALERKYGATSTAHLRAFGPFYGRREIQALVNLPQCTELALHGEFVGNAARYGGQLPAALAEREYLERITGTAIQGVSMHGGELVRNRTQASRDIIESAGFLYDTSLGASPYYFPFRRLTQNGQLEKTYRLRVNFRDIGISPDEHYAENFYKEAMRQIEFVSQQNGILVMMMHPEYFGFFTYLFRPTNLINFLKFLPVYFARVLTKRRMVFSDRK